MSVLGDFLGDLMAHRNGVYQNILKLTMLSTIPEELKTELLMRAANHDKSKLENEREKNGYIGMHQELLDIDYGTPEYKQVVDRYKYCVELHFKANSHHPEHYENGYSDMSIPDKIEMVCDWCAAIKVRDGLSKWKQNIVFNKKKFNIPDDEFEKIMNIARFVILDDETMLYYPNFIEDYKG